MELGDFMFLDTDDRLELFNQIMEIGIQLSPEMEKVISGGRGAWVSEDSGQIEISGLNRREAVGVYNRIDCLEVEDFLLNRFGRKFVVWFVELFGDLYIAFGNQRDIVLFHARNFSYEFSMYVSTMTLESLLIFCNLDEIQVYLKDIGRPIDFQREYLLSTGMFIDGDDDYILYVRTDE